MANPTPGYLVTLFEGGAYFGGVMITNDRGLPLDFKYTDPVMPTKAQRIIYGSVLEQYIRNHVIIGAITQKLELNPSFFVVSQHQIYDIEEAHDMPLISVNRTQFASLGEKGTVSRAKENECLLQPFNDSPHPLRILFGNMPIDRQEALLKDLIYLTKHMDLVEPLERLETAVKSLCLEKNQD